MLRVAIAAGLTPELSDEAVGRLDQAHSDLVLEATDQLLQVLSQAASHLDERKQAASDRLTVVGTVVNPALVLDEDPASPIAAAPTPPTPRSPLP